MKRRSSELALVLAIIVVALAVVYAALALVSRAGPGGRAFWGTALVYSPVAGFVVSALASWGLREWSGRAVGISRAWWAVGVGYALWYGGLFASRYTDMDPWLLLGATILAMWFTLIAGVVAVGAQIARVAEALPPARKAEAPAPTVDEERHEARSFLDGGLPGAWAAALRWVASKVGEPVADPPAFVAGQRVRCIVSTLDRGDASRPVELRGQVGIVERIVWRSLESDPPGRWEVLVRYQLGPNAEPWHHDAAELIAA